MRIVSKSRFTILAIVFLFVAVNVAIYWWRATTTGARSIPSQASGAALERQRQQLAWEQFPVIDLAASGLQEHISRLPAKDCFPVPEPEYSKSHESISRERRLAFDQALTQLLRAYSRDSHSGAAILSLMKSSDMVFDDAQIQKLRRILPNTSAYSSEDVAAFSAEEVYLAYCESLSGTKSSMAGVVIEASCATFWRSKSSEMSVLRQPQDFSWVATVWNGIYGAAPTFVPSQPFSSRDNLGVLVADVQLIIDNRGVDAETRSPYLLRFAYNEAADKWQPLMFSAILLDDASIGSFLF